MPKLGVPIKDVVYIIVSSDGLEVAYLDENKEQAIWEDPGFFNWNFSIVGRISGEDAGITFTTED